MKTIVIATQCYPPAQGGIECLMEIIAQTMCQYGYSVTVLADGSGKYDDSSPITVIRFGQIKWLRRLAKRSKLKQLLSQKTVDVVVFDSWKSAEYLSDLVQKPTLKWVYAHGNELLPKQTAKHVLRLHNSLSNNDQIIAVSSVAQLLLKPYVSKDKRIAVIHNPVTIPPEWIRTASNRPIRHWLTIARLEPRKGIDKVIQALPSLIGDYPDLSYTIIGIGSDEKRLRELAEQYQVTAYVNFTGSVDQIKKYQTLEQADAFIMPTRIEQSNRSIEGLGIAFIEAMAMGLPVVAGYDGGIKDIVQHEHNGWLCEGQSVSAVTQCMRAVMQDATESQKIASNGQDFVTQTLMPKQYMKKLDQLF